MSEGWYFKFNPDDKIGQELKVLGVNDLPIHREKVIDAYETGYRVDFNRLESDQLDRLVTYLMTITPGYADRYLLQLKLEREGIVIGEKRGFAYNLNAPPVMPP